MATINRILSKGRHVDGGPSVFETNLIPFSSAKFTSIDWNLEIVANPSGTASFLYSDDDRTVTNSLGVGDTVKISNTIVGLTVGQEYTFSIDVQSVGSPLDNVHYEIENGDEVLSVEVVSASYRGYGVSFKAKERYITLSLHQTEETVASGGGVLWRNPQLFSRKVNSNGRDTLPPVIPAGSTFAPTDPRYITMQADGELIQSGGAPNPANSNPYNVFGVIGDLSIAKHLETGSDPISRFVDWQNGTIAYVLAGEEYKIDDLISENYLYDAMDPDLPVPFYGVAAYSPGWAFIMLGKDDLLQTGTTGAGLIAMITATLTDWSDSTRPLVFCTIPGFKNSPNANPTINGYRQTVNQWLIDNDGLVIGDTELIVCDIDSVLTVDEALHAKYDDGDGETLSKDGCWMVFKAMRDTFLRISNRSALSNARLMDIPSEIGDVPFDSSGQYDNGRESPAVSGFAITPSDTVDLPSRCDALYVGVEGAVRATLINMDDGTFITFPSLPVGWHPISVKRLWATGTTATSLLGVE